MAGFVIPRIIFSSAAALGLLLPLATLPVQVAGGEQPAASATASKPAAASLQEKAAQAQARIHDNAEDRGQLMRAIKLNEADAAKEVLLRNGFIAEDLSGAKFVLRSGGGK